VLKLQKDPSDVLNHIIHIKSNLIKEEAMDSVEASNEDDQNEDQEDSSISYHSQGNLSSRPNIIFSLQNEAKHQSQLVCQCPSVLIVDDEPYNLIAIEGLLLLHGIERLEKSFNGSDAIKKIE
jgi:CheY-like chemotaxis protein